MKKHLFILFIIIIGLSIAYGCKEKTLPMMEYPLDVATIEAALEETELAWTIEKEETLAEGRIVYTLHDEDGSLVSFILSQTRNEQRLLDVSLMPYSDNPTITQSIPEEEWEKVIELATILYGGFDSKAHVYDSFIDDYNKENMVWYRKTKDNKEISTWKSELNGIYCIIRIEKPNLNLSYEYLNSVIFDNSDDL